MRDGEKDRKTETKRKKERKKDDRETSETNRAHSTVANKLTRDLLLRIGNVRESK